MADLVEETVRGIRARLKELRPVMAEYERLQAAYAALDGAGGEGVEDRRSAGGGPRDGQGGVGRARGRATSRRAGTRAKRGQNKAAVHGVIAQRPGVTVTEIGQVTRISKPLVYNTARAGIQRGELERVSLPGGQQGFRMAQAVSFGERDASPPQASERS